MSEAFDRWATHEMHFPLADQQALAGEIARACRHAIAASSAETAAKIHALMALVSGTADGRAVREQSAAMLRALSYNILLHCDLMHMGDTEEALYDATELANEILPEEIDDTDDGASVAPLRDDLGMRQAMHRAAVDGFSAN
jgi:hypothetical protein